MNVYKYQTWHLSKYNYYSLVLVLEDRWVLLYSKGKKCPLKHPSHLRCLTHATKTRPKKEEYEVKLNRSETITSDGYVTLKGIKMHRAQKMLGLEQVCMVIRKGTMR